ncbi:MAG: M20/M25/M40 family metallo-hydrolase [Herpetosiphonaceae bacterium]|nr:M20/M25/M40 family metallo-hydrolase [Herpetosiphonaceae bacterium]
MDLRTELVDLTRRLVAVPSVSAESRDLNTVIDLVVAELADLPGVQLHRRDAGGFPMLVVAFDERREADIILNAHLDVVPARPEQWTVQERDGRLYGRGTQDMKGAGAVYIRLIKDIAALPAAQRPSVIFQFVTDEEIGGAHGTARLRDEGWVGNLFIAGEPTDLNICHGAKGILWIEIEQPGVPAHGSRPWEGVNPIERLAAGLRRLLDIYPPPSAAIWRTTVTAAIIKGGDAGNRIPADCMLRLDVRWTPEEGVDTVIANIERAFASDTEPQARVIVRQQGTALRTAADDPQLERIRQAQASALGAEPATFREHFGSDARFYSDVKIPAVCWGPVGAGLHTDDEWVSIDGLVDYYKAVRVLLGLQ